MCWIERSQLNCEVLCSYEMVYRDDGFNIFETFGDDFLSFNIFETFGDDYLSFDLWHSIRMTGHSQRESELGRDLRVRGKRCG